jgi:hypothetical protein
MARTSIVVSEQKSNAAFVASALTVHEEPVVTGLLANNAALPPEDHIDPAVLKQLFAWLGKLLQQKGNALAAAEAAYVSEQADDVPLRIERDARHETLSAHSILVRDRVETHIGRDSLAAYGLSNRTPRTAPDLLIYAKTASALMREQPREVPDGMGGVLSTVALADSLDGMCSALDASVQQLVNEQRELDAARAARNTAQGELVAMYQMIAGLLVYVFRLAGHPDLADRIRPVVRAARRPAPPDDGTTLPPDDGTTLPPDGDAPGAAPDAPAVTPARR